MRLTDLAKLVLLIAAASCAIDDPEAQPEAQRPEGGRSPTSCIGDAGTPDALDFSPARGDAAVVCGTIAACRQCLASSVPCSVISDDAFYCVLVDLNDPRCPPDTHPDSYYETICGCIGLCPTACPQNCKWQ